MKENREVLRLVEICRLYYEKELTQAEIARRLNISRPAVSKLLAEARKEGIVRIEIRSPLDSDENLLDKLSRLFNLQGGLIIPSVSRDNQLITDLIVSQASVYFEKLLPSLQKVGVGWGSTLGAMLDALEPQTLRGADNCLVCPVIGNAPNAIRWLQTNELTRIFAQKTGYTPYYLHAPAFPASEENKQLFMNTLECQKVSDLWDNLDAVILGVGTYPTVPDQATAVRFGKILKEKKAVGTIATYYFDEEGEIIDSPNDIVIRIPRKQLKKTTNVFALCGGMEKLTAIRGALLTGLVTHLITDETTARELLKLHLKPILEL